MKEKQIKLPGPDHPISVQRNPARVVVSVAGRVVADTRNALTLREAVYPPVQYIPGEDVDFSQLERTDHATYCPYKGDCSYYSVPAGGNKSVNAAWAYEDPFPAVEQIRGHVAFYSDRVDEIEQQPAVRRP
jgi:uncharacterized protein (DUF427 family)